MFIDFAKIKIKAGNGGNGSASFRREKSIPRGGPDGGDGGRGGSIILVGDKNISTLRDFRYRKNYLAQNGADGRSRNMKGKDGQNLIIKVPLGTIIKEKNSGKIIVDVNDQNIEYLVLKGGKGGFGNQHFATPTRRSPHFARAGEIADELEVILELKSIADVGIIGFPNAGKSTLLSVVSEARPKIASYPFTTLFPNLGVVRTHDTESVWADIPGIIEGASSGAGLGYQFLRHVERTRLLIHVLDASESYFEIVQNKENNEETQINEYAERILTKFNQLNDELKKYNSKLASKEQVVVLNKSDMVANKEYLDFAKKKFNNKVFIISAYSRDNINALINTVNEELSKIPNSVSEIYSDDEMYIKPEEKLFEINLENGIYKISGKWIEKLLRSTNLDDIESLNYFQKLLERRGVNKELRKLGVQQGDTVEILDYHFDYMP